ncbi:MAG: hypothetical protein MZU95_15725 [Desulfomicrobium escambiense]|nr:hypothetical protein [Desulfomicrobium escambiense]
MKSSRIFHYLSEPEITVLLGACEEVRFDKDERIITERESRRLPVPHRGRERTRERRRRTRQGGLHLHPRQGRGSSRKPRSS